MKKALIFNLLMGLSLYSLADAAQANSKLFCSKGQTNKQMIIAYLGADSSWKLKDTDLVKLEEQLGKVSLVNYSFIRLATDEKGNTILKPSDQDIENIELIHQIKPDLPIMIAVGGWGERDGFKPFLENEEKMTIFLNSVKQILKQNRLDGIDIDWENELLASKGEIAGVATLLQRLNKMLSQEGYCITNAVPGTEAYWTQYPDAKLWQAYVNWTTVMAYDNYGTFGPRTEHGAALYEPNRKEDKTYPYPNTSGSTAVKHYYQQGLPAEKIILGLPFYCHSYFINNRMIDKNSSNPGLYVPVLDPNISSQMSYNEAYTTYGDRLYSYQYDLGEGGYKAVTFYGLLPIEQTQISRFMSCDGPESILDKIAYVEGKNTISDKAQKSHRLGGVSFWSLQQDLPFSHANSLLRAIHTGFNRVD